MMTPNEFTTAVAHYAQTALEPLRIEIEFRSAEAWRFTGKAGALGHAANFTARKKDEPKIVIAEGMISVRDFERSENGARFMSIFVVRQALEGCVKIHRDRLASVAFHWDKIADLIGVVPKR